MSSTALAPRQSAVSHPATAIRSRSDLEYWAENARRSGFFKGAEDMSRGVVKIAFGLEYGLTPIQALSSVHIIEGKPSLPGHVLAALIDNSDRYKYRVENKSAEQCVLRFYKRDLDTREWEDLGTESYTIQQATGAGLTTKANWKNYPDKMLFWRALMNGFDIYCSGLSVGKAYTHDEMGADAVAVEDVEYVEHVEGPALLAEPAVYAIDPQDAAEIRDLLDEMYGEQAEAKAGPLAMHFSGGATDDIDGLTLEQGTAFQRAIEQQIRQRAEAADTAPTPAPAPAASDDGPLPPADEVAAWVLPAGQDAPDKPAHAKARKRVMAEGNKQFADWDESSKGARDGVRHRLISSMTLGATDSAARLTTEGLAQLLAEVHRTSGLGREVPAPEPIDPALRKRIADGATDALVAALVDGLTPLQPYAVAAIAAKVGVAFDAAGDDPEAWSDALLDFPDAGLLRLGEIVLDPDLARRYNREGFLANAATLAPEQDDAVAAYLESEIAAGHIDHADTARTALEALFAGR